MELSFAPKEQSGWRGRGAPRKKVPDDILRVLRHTETTGDVGIIDVRDDTDADIREAKLALRAGARHMGRILRLQHDEEAHQIRFQLAPRSAP